MPVGFIVNFHLPNIAKKMYSSFVQMSETKRTRKDSLQLLQN